VFAGRPKGCGEVNSPSAVRIGSKVDTGAAFGGVQVANSDPDTQVQSG
jgi:hypothetical protein